MHQRDVFMGNVYAGNISGRLSVRTFNQIGQVGADRYHKYMIGQGLKKQDRKGNYYLTENYLAHGNADPVLIDADNLIGRIEANSKKEAGELATKQKAANEKSGTSNSSPSTD